MRRHLGDLLTIKILKGRLKNLYCQNRDILGSCENYLKLLHALYNCASNITPHALIALIGTCAGSLRMSSFSWFPCISATFTSLQRFSIVLCKDSRASLMSRSIFFVSRARVAASPWAELQPICVAIVLDVGLRVGVELEPP